MRDQTEKHEITGRKDEQALHNGQKRTRDDRIRRIG